MKLKVAGEVVRVVFLLYFCVYISRTTMKNGPLKRDTHGRYNFNIHKKVKEMFHRECSMQFLDMSETVEKLMYAYAVNSKKVREAQKLVDKKNGKI